MVTTCRSQFKAQLRAVTMSGNPNSAYSSSRFMPLVQQLKPGSQLINFPTFQPQDSVDYCSIVVSHLPLTWNSRMVRDVMMDWPAPTNGLFGISMVDPFGSAILSFSKSVDTNTAFRYWNSGSGRRHLACVAVTPTFCLSKKKLEASDVPIVHVVSTNRLRFGCGMAT